MENTLIIKGGNLVDPANSINGVFDLLIRDGRIAQISSDGFDTPSIKGELKIIDAYGCYVAPGFVDAHSHFRDPGFTDKEDIHSGALAAAAGGYTSVILMANTDPAVDNEEIYTEISQRAEDEKIHIYQCASITKKREGRELVDMDRLVKAGVRGFTDDGSPISDEKLAERAMEEAAYLGIPLSFHEEDPGFIGTAGINEGDVSEKLGINGAGRQAETAMIERDVKLALKHGCKIDIQHISSLEGVELIRAAKLKDTKGIIHAEATPNHFSLTEDAIMRYGTNAKINPPLRTERDRKAIIEGLADGTIDLIATDHAPHTAQDKARGGWFSCEGDYIQGKSPRGVLPELFGKAPSGILGLETALSLSFKNLINPGFLTMNEFINRISVNPAALYGLDAGKLSIGSKADITIFTDKIETEYKSFRSKSSNSPYLGAVLPGRVMYTICGGEVIYEASGTGTTTVTL